MSLALPRVQLQKQLIQGQERSRRKEVELNRPGGEEECPPTPTTHTPSISNKVFFVQPEKGKEEIIMTLNSRPRKSLGGHHPHSPASRQDREY